MKVLITGGAGFVGSHLAEAYLKRGDEIWILDDLSTGGIRNVEHLKSEPGFHYVVDTVMNLPLLAECIDRCDIVIHLAAAVGVRLIVESPVNTIETNIRGTENVLSLANKKKKKVLIASTSEVYGKSERVPFAEDDDLVLGATRKGRWSYACSKAIDEFLAIAYWKEKQLPVVIARLFNTVGPRQTGRYGMVIPTFVRQALQGRSGTITGLDYRGAVVLAAYEPVKVLNLGLVAKIDLAEIRAPFIKAGVVILALAIFSIAVGVLLFQGVFNYLYRSLQKSEADHAKAQQIAHLGNWSKVQGKSKVQWSDELYRIYGFSK